MTRRKKIRRDGTRVPKRQHQPRPPPPPGALETLERLTDDLPEPLRAFRDLHLIGPERRWRLEQAIARRTRSLVVLLDGVHDPHNQAAVMRTSEALGLQELHLIDRPGAPLNPSDRVTQAADQWLDLVVHADHQAAVEALQARGMQVMAAALDARAVSLYEVDFTRPTAVVFGNESRGLDARVISACDGTFAIPMYGLSQSLNISVAAAVTLAWAVESRRRAWGTPGDLDGAAKMVLRRRFYCEAARGRIPRELRERLDAME